MNQAIVDVETDRDHDDKIFLWETSFVLNSVFIRFLRKL